MCILTRHNSLTSLAQVIYGSVILNRQRKGVYNPQYFRAMRTNPFHTEHYADYELPSKGSYAAYNPFYSHPPVVAKIVPDADAQETTPFKSAVLPPWSEDLETIPSNEMEHGIAYTGAGTEVRRYSFDIGDEMGMRRED